MNGHASFNRFYRLVWSQVTQTWHAVSELTSGRGKGSSRSRQLVMGAMAGVALAMGAARLHAQQAPPAVNRLPTGGVVAQGAATIAQTATAQAASMTINQSSQRAVINWNSFNVGKNASVVFNQPNAQSVTLNRIADQNPSQIFGQIQANGQVFLSNPSGVYFSPTAQVDVGALVATTHSIADNDFMAGNMTFSRNGATGSVINEGQLNARLNGYMALLAPEVRNSGVVVAQAGTVALAAGEAITLNFNGTGNLAGITTTPSAIASLVDNKQAVLAPDGQIILSAVALNKLNAGVIKNSGSLEASSISHKGGMITLEGDDITLSSTSSIKASGATGGGTVLVGGDWQGSGNLRQATQVTMEAGATIDANATRQGDGGKVVLWSDVRNPDSLTRVAGSIQAEGGPQGGQGGQVETSGHALQVDSTARVFAQAGPGGTSGLWLLDPEDITITSSDLNNTVGSVSSGVATITPTASGTSTVSASTITTALNSSNVRVSTGGGTVGTSAGNILIAADITMPNAYTLEFLADGGISGTGNITVNNSTSSVSFNQAANSTYSGVISGIGSFTKDGAGSLSLTQAQTYTGSTNIYLGTLNPLAGLNASTMVVMKRGGVYSVSIDQAVKKISDVFGMTGTAPSIVIDAGKTLTITGSLMGNTSFSGAISGNGSLVFNASGTLSGSNSYTGTTSVNAGTLTVSGSLSDTTAMTVNSGASYFAVASDTIGSLAGAGTVSIGSNKTLTIANGNSAAPFSGVLKNLDNSNPGSLAIAGGTQVLTGVNTYTGTTTINSGATLQIGDGGSSGALASASNIVDNGTLAFNTSTTQSVANAISGTGALRQMGTGVITLSGNVTNASIPTVDAGAGNLCVGSTCYPLTVQFDPSTLTSSAQVQSMTQSDVSGISNAGVSALTTTQMSYLTATQLGYFSASQLQQLSSSQVQAVTASLSGLSSAQVGAIASTMSSAQIQALSTGQVSGLTSVQVGTLASSLTSTQALALTSAQIGGLTSAQVGTITTTLAGTSQMGSLSSAQVGAMAASLTSSQVLALTSTQLGGLTSAQVGTITTTLGASMSSLSSAQVGAMAASLTSSQVQALTSGQVGGLTSAQVGAMASSLTSTQVLALTSTQMSSLTSAQVGAITATLAASSQMSSLSSTQVGAMAGSLTSSQVQALTSGQVSGLTSAQVGAVASSLTSTQVLALTSTQLGDLTAAQVGTITTTLTASSQMSSLSSAQVGAIVSSLTSTQVQALTSGQMGGLTSAQVGAMASSLTSAQVQALTSSQTSGLTAAQVGAVIASLTSAQMQTLTANQISALSAQQLASLSASHQAILQSIIANAASNSNTSSVAAAAATAQTVGSLIASVASVGSTQTSASPSSNAAAFAPMVMGGGAPVIPSLMSNLSPAQMAVMSPAQMQSITPTALSVLSPVQLASVSPAQVSNLSNAQVQAMTPTQLGSLSAGQVQALTPTQIGAMSNAQVESLTPAQMASMSPAQLNALAPAQAQTVLNAGGNALSAEQRSVLTGAATSPAGTGLGTGAGMSAPSGATSANATTSGSAQAAAPGGDGGNTSTGGGAVASAQPAMGAGATTGASAVASAQPAVGTAATTGGGTQAATSGAVGGNSTTGIGAVTSALPATGAGDMAATPAPTSGSTAPSATSVSTLTAGDIQAFRPAQVRSLTETQITTLSPTQVQAFTPRQLASMSAPQLQTLDATQVQALQPQQLSGLSVKQVAAFSADQLSTMSRPQAVALMRNRANLLNTGQSAFTPAQRAAVNEVLSSTVSTSSATVTSNANGVLPVAVVGAVASPGIGVKFDAQGTTSVKLRMADVPVSNSVASNRLNAQYTTIEARNANNETVKFRGAIVDNRLVIAAGSPTSRQMARTELPSMLSSAMSTLGTGSTIAIDGLKGVVLNMR